MNQDIENQFLEKAALFKALAHPTRLFIINAVKDKKLSVKELTELVGVDISTMSKHLSILKNHKIIKGKKDKNYIYYSLEIPCVLDFMTCAVKVIEKNK
ncbi:metalloregulator ArsR/SmtB family transcription factor [Lutibacter sp. A64]|uniref:ArsR/SmtB family transcription factor n=1 Tax=Lutibacter sp. A64 TaxID=2918526 RepID=UPI001F0601F1|nr:metalloregulator ArsR/SmtB family transcription factor [Lutibacter sp. A64]UMB53248.1 metalloregulator ArsR/SmtB family transcription factor [Lutibacter sp. A64]